MTDQDPKSTKVNSNINIMVETHSDNATSKLSSNIMIHQTNEEEDTKKEEKFSSTNDTILGPKELHRLNSTLDNSASSIKDVDSSHSIKQNPTANDDNKNKESDSESSLFQSEEIMVKKGKMKFPNEV